MSSLDQELETSYRYTGSLHWYKQAIVLMLALPIIYLIIGGEYLRCVHVVHVACYVVGCHHVPKDHTPFYHDLIGFVSLCITGIMYWAHCVLLVLCIGHIVYYW